MNLPASPAWTLQGNKTRPGPAYNLSHLPIYTNSISFTTGRSQRSNINGDPTDGPGPADYNTMTERGNPLSFPKQSRKIDQKDDNPTDPFMYYNQTNCIKPQHPQYTIGYKYETDYSNPNPGPADYQHYAQTTRTSKFGIDNRFSERKGQGPGPASYNLSREMGDFKKGGLAKSRRSLDMREKVPGPGEYELREEIGVRDVGKSLGQKLGSSVDLRSNTKDAFHNYLREETKFGKTGFTIAKSRKSTQNDPNLPGPSDYKIKSATFNSTTGTKFPKGQHLQKHNFNPGPGQYHTSKSSTVIYSIPRSKSQGLFNKNPGVGRYSSDLAFDQTRKKSLSHLIGKSNRTDFVSKNGTGVGDYDVLEKKMGGVTIPKAERFVKNNANPGPGEYHLHSTISNWNLYQKKKK